MPTFDTPSPIAVTVELYVGDIQIEASDRIDTIVEVRPSDPGKKGDVAAAEQARVEYTDGRLLIRAVKGWKQYTFRGGRESIDVRIALPAGSNVQGEAGMAAVRCTGGLGECRFKTGLGDIRIEQAGPVELKTGSGDISVGRTVGRTQITTGSGSIRVDSIDGTAVIKNSNGDTWIGAVTGDLRVHAANGKIAVDRAQAGVAAKTANGDVRLGEVTRGAILAETARGKVDVAVVDGVAAWLDLVTSHGNVHNDLEAAEGPEPGEDAVEIHAHTSLGDITIHRSAPALSQIASAGPEL